MSEPGCKPILMSGWSVQRILADEKIETRRVVRFKAPFEDHRRWPYCVEHPGGGWIFSDAPDPPPVGKRGRLSPYGNPGDRLWVREKQRVIAYCTTGDGNGGYHEQIRVRYEADGAESNWIEYPARLKGKPRIGRYLSYGGYRESSRIDLELLDVWPERLQNISEKSILAEGIEPIMMDSGGTTPWGEWIEVPDWYSPFMNLWDSFNAVRGYPFESNSWVWALRFKRLKP